MERTARVQRRRQPKKKETTTTSTVTTHKYNISTTTRDMFTTSSINKQEKSCQPAAVCDKRATITLTFSLPRGSRYLEIHSLSYRISVAAASEPVVKSILVLRTKTISSQPCLPVPTALQCCRPLQTAFFYGAVTIFETHFPDVHPWSQ